MCDCLCRGHVTVPLHDNVSPLPSSPSPSPSFPSPSPSFPSPSPPLSPPPHPPPLILQYASVEQLFEDLNLLFDSTCLAYPRESLLYKVSHASCLILPLQASNPLPPSSPSSLIHTQDAIVLHRAAVKKYLQLTGKKTGVECLELLYQTTLL